MSDNLIQSTLPGVESSEITQSEKSLIFRLRELNRKREQYGASSTGQTPLGMIVHEGRRYLEIHAGFVPILVPERVKDLVQDLIRQYIAPYVRHLNSQSMASAMVSPPLSQFVPSFGMPAAALPSFMANLSPLSSPHLVPNYNVVSSLPSFSLSEPPSLPWTPATPAQTNIGSPVMDNTRDTSITPSDVSHYENIGLASPPYLPETFETDEPTPLPQHVSTAVQPSHAHSVHPRLETKETPSVGPHKRSSSTESSSSKQSGNDADDEFQAGDANNDSGPTELRKPPNAFILYRKAINKKLREQQPNINVETASTIIGKYWREESAEVKKGYKDMANAEREKYFIKKKQLQTQLKRKRLEREEHNNLAQARPTAKVQRIGSPECHPIKQELICSESRELSSFAPEALARGSQKPLVTASYDNLPQALEKPPAFTRSLTVGCERQLPTMHLLESPGYIGNEAVPQSMALPSNCGPSTSAFNQHVASSLEQLRSAFNHPLQSPPMTSMSVDISSMESAELQSFSNLAGSGASTGESEAKPANEPTGLKNMLNLLFQKNS
ncbi:hypothetical protein H4R24_001114 [Coemansia sp. RSA 988]|nr:hypothetical protein H4R24_001114 [Coemansia sp. RSA 988]